MKAQDFTLIDRDYAAWQATEEGQEIMATVESMRQRFREILGTSSYPEYIDKITREIEGDCKEIGRLVEQDFGVNPIPERVIDFFMDEVNPLTPASSTDELIRMYARWRRERYHSGEKWVKLYNGLADGGYIKGATLQVFSYAMDHKTLPPGTKKIKWLTFKADTLYLGKRYGFTIKELNSCFESKNGKPFHGHNRGGTRTKKFEALFE